jgi:glycosyltransferase involved in cell wall biosynthesis
MMARRTLPLVVNGRFLTQRVTGVQRYAIEVTRRLKVLRPDLRVLTPTGVIHHEIARELGAERVGRLRGHAWEQVELPWYRRGAGLINLCNAAPVTVTKQIVTIHDCAPFAVPEAYSRAFTQWYRFITRQIGQRARHILTVSHFSAGELNRYLKIDPAKITVIPLGREHVFACDASYDAIERHKLGNVIFLLAVGSHSPHKNFAALVTIAEKLNNADCRFVIVGGADPRVHASNPTALDERVIHVGAVSDAELRALYENAAGYVHPAYYEGFGLPPLEAMALGCPVLTSRAAALPETCGNAAAYFDPFDMTDMVTATQRFLADADHRAGLAQAGRERAQMFSWDECARAILESAEANLA